MNPARLIHAILWPFVIGPTALVLYHASADQWLVAATVLVYSAATLGGATMLYLGWRLIRRLI